MQWIQNGEQLLATIRDAKAFTQTHPGGHSRSGYRARKCDASGLRQRWWRRQHGRHPGRDRPRRAARKHDQPGGQGRSIHRRPHRRRRQHRHGRRPRRRHERDQAGDQPADEVQGVRIPGAEAARRGAGCGHGLGGGARRPDLHLQAPSRDEIRPEAADQRSVDDGAGCDLLLEALGADGELRRVLRAVDHAFGAVHRYDRAGQQHRRPEARLPLRCAPVTPLCTSCRSRRTAATTRAAR